MERLNDRRGLAETLDLIGIAYYVAGDNLETASHFQRAAELFRELGDRQGVTWCLSTLVLVTGGYQTDAGMTVAAEFDDTLRSGEPGAENGSGDRLAPGCRLRLQRHRNALRRSRALRRAFDNLHNCMAVSEEIGHRQWWVAGLCGYGALYVDLLAAEPATHYLQRAVTEAREMNSRLWTFSSTPELAAAFLVDHDLDAADAVLDQANAPTHPRCQTKEDATAGWYVPKSVWHVDDGEEALRIIDELIATAPHVTEQRQVPRLARIRGEALMRLCRFEDAEASLVASREGAAAADRPSHLWRALVALGHLYRQQRRYAEAEAAFSEARARHRADLADTVPDPDIRRTFLRETAALMPAPRKATQRRAAKQAFGGLTARERQVAALVAEGLSNRDIADRLFVSERTTATHVGHILDKLQFTSRTQIATWAIEVGLERQE